MGWTCEVGMGTVFLRRTQGGNKGVVSFDGSIWLGQSCRNKERQDDH